MRSSYTFLKNYFNSFSIALLSLFLILGINGNIYGQLSVSTNFANNNGASVIIFTFYNGNSYPVDIKSIGTYAGTTGAKTAQLWTKPVTGFGQATNASVNVTNGWTLQSTESVTTTANTTATVGATAPIILSGITFSVPANSYYLFCVSLGTSIRYSTLGTQPGIFTSDGCTINCTAGNGFGGSLTSPANTPRGFIGIINFAPSYIPTPLDLGVSSFLKPLGSKKCFGTDTIVVRLKNYGTATADFSVTPTDLTVITTGPNAGTYTLAINSGTLASNATEDFTLSTTYDLSNIGTYKLKGYTTVAGDGSPLNDTTNLTITKKPFFTTSVLPNDSLCLGVPAQLNANISPLKQVGSGIIANSSTAYPAPYGNNYEAAKHQFLFLASELTSAGLSAGNINSISFNATNLNGTDPLTNYNISIATTTLNNITTFQTTGFTNYFSATSYTPVLGTNSHLFSSPFIWDGTSNIVIETCFDNSATVATNNVSITQSSTPFTSSIWFRADNNFTVCSTSTTSSGTMSQRPNISFEQPTVITYSWSPALELSATNIPNPIAIVSSSRTYSVSGTISGCMSYDTVRIYIKPTPAPDLGKDSVYCNLPVIINANTIADSYLWSNNTTGASLNVTGPGEYWVKATNTNGCESSDTVLVSLGALPIVTLGPDTAYCQGSTINLYAGFGNGNTYLWNTGSTASFITTGVTGTYSVVVTNSIGCKSSDIINVTSKLKPTVSMVFIGATTFCAADGIAKTLSEGTPSGGTYIGAGVNSISFLPNQAGQGTHIIIYTYTGPNGCSNTAKDTLIVNACVGIDEISQVNALNVCPNPNSGIFTLEINTNSTINGKISLASIDGKIVFNELLSGNGLITKSINITDLANGIYYLKLETEDGIKTYKVLKQ